MSRWFQPVPTPSPRPTACAAGGVASWPSLQTDSRNPDDIPAVSKALLEALDG